MLFKADTTAAQSYQTSEIFGYNSFKVCLEICTCKYSQYERWKIGGNFIIKRVAHAKCPRYHKPAALDLWCRHKNRKKKVTECTWDCRSPGFHKIWAENRVITSLLKILLSKEKSPCCDLQPSSEGSRGAMTSMELMHCTQRFSGSSPDS